MKLLKKMKNRLTLLISILKVLKEVSILVFTKDNRLVKNYVLLIMAGVMTFEEVPNLFNMREAVAEAMGLEYKGE